MVIVDCHCEEKRTRATRPMVQYCLFCQTPCQMIDKCLFMSQLLLVLVPFNHWGYARLSLPGWLASYCIESVNCLESSTSWSLTIYWKRRDSSAAHRQSFIMVPTNQAWCWVTLLMKLSCCLGAVLQHYVKSTVWASRCWWVQCCSKEPMCIFAGGMPRASYGDRHTVSVVHSEKHVVFDFSSKVIDYFVICDADRRRRLSHSIGDAAGFSVWFISTTRETYFSVLTVAKLFVLLLNKLTFIISCDFSVIVLSSLMTSVFRQFFLSFSV